MMPRRVLHVLAACLLSGCAADVGTFTSLGVLRAPKPETHKVEIFKNGLPSRPFERVAILDAHCESQWFATPSEEDCLPELIHQAQAAGCDAIIEIREKKIEAPGNFETRARHYTGVGVAYR